MSDRESVSEQPLERLLRMQHAALTAGYSLPEAETEQRTGGLAFGVDDQRLVVALTDISDIVDYGRVTPVPCTKSWLRGVANIRGGLYSIVDLEAFLGYEVNETDTEGKFMVVNRDELGCAWLVRSIYGLRYFDDDEDDRGAAEFDERLRPYVTRAFARGNELWGMLDVNRLVDTTAFRDVKQDA